MHQRCSASLEVLISSSIHEDHGNGKLYQDYLEVMDFINDSVVTLDAFADAFKPAALHFSLSFDMSTKGPSPFFLRCIGKQPSPFKMEEREGLSANFHFFKPLMPGFTKKLAIPTAFVKHIVKEKCNMQTATLVSSNGESWSVNVYEESTQGKMYFCGDGWLQVVHTCNLGLGYFLVFCYRGNMKFNFRAYDLSTCEMTYYAPVGSHMEDIVGEDAMEEPSEVRVEDQEASEDDNHEKNECTENRKKKILEVVKIEDDEESEDNNSKKRNQKPLEVVRIEDDEESEDNNRKKRKQKPLEVVKIEDDAESEGNNHKKRKQKLLEVIKIEDDEEFAEFSANKKMMMDKYNDKKDQKNKNIEKQKTSGVQIKDKTVVGKSTQISCRKKCVDLHYHEKKKRKNCGHEGRNTRFESIISPSNLTAHYMCIPMEFCNNNDLTRHTELTLMDSKGQSWPVSIWHRRKTAGSARDSSSMCGGWLKFARANGLKRGDKCIFELASAKKEGEVVMHVKTSKKSS